MRPSTSVRLPSASAPSRSLTPASDMTPARGSGSGPAEGTTLGQVPAAGEPKRQVAARRMADHHDPPEIERIGCGERTQLVGGQPDIGEGSGIAAAAVADPAEFDVPRGDAAVGERLGETAR